ncbi:helix-turn-helix domain-containing protein [Rhizobium sp. AN80A]|uniref:winged helix-turn-helix transcriptional regulator n=1 Tax=Rhizobium sp. AN80A TaxID=3040673 RepID=UPI0024B39BC2|nr:helix-turn-helix domain-containing protein [Rhizobium sp. AN80A]
MSDVDPVYRADCPSREILDQIADKWSMLVLAVLIEPRRFNAIKRRLDGVTQRVLTQTLRKLERNGMVSRRILPGPPLGVEYARTPLGNSLQGPFSQLYLWTVQNMDEIQSRQFEYDTRDTGH